MNLEAQRKLKFDRRLAGRRGMATDAELAVELAKLPDAADKVWRPASGETDDRQPASPEEGRP